ncbi:Universal stress protein family protein [Formosa sp. Hel1_31_208]|uniref:universal stress protein n=1 Tax=Formosa sp. Hel1_31_208 TaxID=1798225 RepID=UPI00087B867C|nr:universal stress protein [Formosa sp. Hel1_31_208]SDR69793.1 Universal stress protein family protein [Formosa sp. Hel1_31_208]
MKNNKYKILVLSDLKQSAEKTLRYAAKLSLEIDANVEFFYAKEATEVVQTENPLSAMRTISEVCNQTERKIKDLVNPISKENNINIKSTFAFGNIKNDIETCINTSNPDLIILGERKQKRFNFLGDRISHYVNKRYNGVVLVVTDSNVLDSEGKVSLNNLGLKNNIDNYKVQIKNELVS